MCMWSLAGAIFFPSFFFFFFFVANISEKMIIDLIAFTSNFKLFLSFWRVTLLYCSLCMEALWKPKAFIEAKDLPFGSVLGEFEIGQEKRSRRSSDEPRSFWRTQIWIFCTRFLKPNCDYSSWPRFNVGYSAFLV